MSGQPVQFVFSTGEKKASPTALEHSALIALIEETAPTDVFSQLKAGQAAKYDYRNQDGKSTLEIRPVSSVVWQVGIKKFKLEGLQLEGKAEQPHAGRPSVGQAAGQPQAAPSPNPPKADEGNHSKPKPTPNIQSVAGEPRINRLLRIMKALGASDLHLSSTVPAMCRLHGDIIPLEESGPLSHEDLKSLLWEIMPERNRNEFTEKSDTDFAHMIEGLSRFRANVFMDMKGIGAVFRQIPFHILSPEQLGIPKPVLDLCYLSKGLVVVTGPTGSGKSTTLATLIDVINQKRNDHIITIEDPIEFVHPNKRCLVNQREVGVHTLGFKNALRAALREDPDIVLVGEMRDLETIAIAIETAETGHLVFGTLHTTTAPSTVDRIIDQFPGERQAQIRTMLSESLKGVVAQMLCKKKGGGRVAAYEVLIGNPAVANLIREGKTFQLVSTMQTGRNIGMQTMTEHLFELVKNGIVEPEEAYIKGNDKAALKDLFAKNNIPLKL